MMKHARSGRFGTSGIRRLAFALSAGLILAGVGSSVTPAAAAPKTEAEKTTRLADIMPYFDKYLGLKPSDRDRFRIVYTLKSKSGGPLPKMLLQTAQGPVPLPVTPDLRLDVPEALYRENPVLTVEGPRGQVSLSLTLKPDLPSGLDLPVTLVTESMSEANKAISSYAGAAALFAPKMQGISMKFPAKTAAPGVRNKDGSVVALKAGKDGGYEFRPSKFRNAEALVFNAEPLTVEFVD